MSETKIILDACCGSRMFWFDKENPLILFADIRDEEHTLCDGRSLKVHPDIVSDFTDMPFPDDSFPVEEQTPVVSEDVHTDRPHEKIRNRQVHPLSRWGNESADAFGHQKNAEKHREVFHLLRKGDAAFGGKDIRRMRHRFGSPSGSFQ